MKIRLFSEALGTFMLTFAVGTALTSKVEYGPFLVGAALFGAMGLTGFVSGAMFNPAMTIGVFLSKFLSN